MFTVNGKRFFPIGAQARNSSGYNDAESETAFRALKLLRCLTQYVSLDEGHFDQDDAFVVDRARNGDEANHGIWVEPDTGVVRAILCD